MDNKFIELFKSRKFWSLIASLVAVAAGYFSGGVNLFDSLQLIVAAFAAYSIGTGLDNRLPPVG